MKITTFLLLISFAGFAATGYSQPEKVTIQLKDASMKDFFNKVEQQTVYKFLYRDDAVESIHVSLDEANMPLDQVLHQALGGSKFGYKILANNLIVIAPNDLLQQTKVTGTVTDGKTGEALTGVNVSIKGTTTGVVTGPDGKFTITATDPNAILIFSFIGYLSEIVPVEGKSIINVKLNLDVKTLEEVVVVGYGTQKKVNVTGAVSTVRADELTVAPVANVTNTLAGRLPGLISKQESGKPGSDYSSLSIRGFGAPLVIVDGIEASFNTLDANEIESVTILKDASAAIYGSRAGNGVLLVTTKRGNTGKPTIEFNNNWMFQGVTNMPQLTSSGQRAELIREAWLNAGNPESTCRFTREDIDLFYAGTNPDYPNTDWWKIAMKDWAPEKQQNLSVRGGNDKIKYFGFLSYLDQESMFTNGGGYKRYNLQSNIDAKITDNLSLQLDLSGIIEKEHTPDRDQNSTIWQEYWISEPFWPSKLPNGKIAYAGAGAAIGIHHCTNMDNTGYYKNDESDLKGTVSLKYNFSQIKGLSAKALGNYHQYYRFYKSFSYLSDSWSYNYSNDTYTQWTSATLPQLYHSDSRNLALTGQFSFNFDRTFAEKHQVSALILYEVIDYYNDAIIAQRKNYTTTAIDYLFAGAVDSQFANGSASEMGRQSYIGRINYSYESKYLLESTLRVDESAKFDKEHRRGFFPGVSLGWRLSEENFIKDNVASLENLKLRASYSQAGNDDVGNFKYLSGYTYGLPYIIGSSASAGLVTTGLENPLLTWEKMKTYNLGLDFSLTKRKLFGELDFFYRDRDGILGTKIASLPTTFGATFPTVNLNSISTRGFDFMIGNEGQWNDLKWDITANISWSRSKWEYYDEPEYTDEDSKRQNKLTGRWTDVTFGYKSDGLFISQAEIDALTFVYDETKRNQAVKPGTIRYVDTNKDGLLNWRDQIEIGKGTTPHWMGGVNINLHYKDFDLSALFQGAFGFYFNTLGGAGGGGNLLTRITQLFSTVLYNERWTEENNHQNGLLPRMGVAYIEYPSDFYYKKADYLRLKTMSVGYNIPNSLIDIIELEKCRIYIAGTNLLTLSGLTKYSMDPEAPNGMFGYYYPQMRTITFGLNLSF